MRDDRGRKPMAAIVQGTTSSRAIYDVYRQPCFNATTPIELPLPPFMLNAGRAGEAPSPLRWSTMHPWNC